MAGLWSLEGKGSGRVEMISGGALSVHRMAHERLEFHTITVAAAALQ
jgi:hypothetical protein